MVESANGISDFDLSNLFTSTKTAALEWVRYLEMLMLISLSKIYLSFQFNALKMGDDLGDDRFSNSFRKRLEKNFDSFFPFLKQINKGQREKVEMERERERERIRAREIEIVRQKKVLQEKESWQNWKTGGGALAGAGVGAMLGGPPGAVVGFFLGGLFGYM